jgi:heme A synthase
MSNTAADSHAASTLLQLLSLLLTRGILPVHTVPELLYCMLHLHAALLILTTSSPFCKKQ